MMNGAPHQPIGRQLRQFRLAAGLSQAALAEASGVSVRTISDLERGQRAGAHPETVRLLASALELTEDQRHRLAQASRAAALPIDDPASEAWRARPSSTPWAQTLPTPATSLIGRSRDLDTIASILAERTCEIITLTGAGGVGKTRLAIDAGHRMASSFAGGVAFIDLAQVTRPELFPDAIAQGLGMPPQPLAASGSLIRFLASRELLLILDNMEQIVEAAPFVAQLAAECPHLTILVTSRQRLRLSAEREVVVPPLGLADLDDPLEQLQSNDANRLFAERARKVDPRFTLSDQNAVAVTEICRRLDGLPLAIELAASRLRVLSVAALLDRLDRRLPLLTDGVRDLHPRQQSMRATISWSYDLLEAEAQRFLRWMAVFAGGVSLESVEALGGALGVPSHEALEMVTTLLDYGLLQRVETPDESGRFKVFETIREFGLEQLAAEGEVDAAREFHAEHFLSYATQDLVLPYEPLPARWLVKLASEHHNLVQAFDTLCRPETAERSLRFAAAMATYWRYRGPYPEGLSRIARAIEMAPEEPSVLKAHALCEAAGLFCVTNDLRRAQQTAQVALDVAEQVGSTADRAMALQMLAWIEEFQKHWAVARKLLLQTLEIWERLDNALMQGQCCMVLGGIAFTCGEVDRAQRYEERAVEHFMSIGDDAMVAGALWYLGMFAAEQGRLDLAAERYAESLQWWLRANSERTWFKVLAGLADVAAAASLYDTAARLLGATDEALSMLGADLMPFDKPGYARAENACRDALDAGEFAEFRAYGRRLSPQAWLDESRTIVEATS